MTLFLLFVLAVLIGTAIYLFVLKKQKPILPQNLPQKIEKPPTPPTFSTTPVTPYRPPAPPVPPAPPTPPPIPPRPPVVPPQNFNNPPLP